MKVVLPASWSEERGSTGRQPNSSPGKTWHIIIDQAYDGQRCRVHQVEDNVEPIIYLSLNEGSGVHDLDIVGLMHHHCLNFSLPPPPSGQTPRPKSPLYFWMSWIIKEQSFSIKSSELWKLLEESEACFQANQDLKWSQHKRGQGPIWGQGQTRGPGQGQGQTKGPVQGQRQGQGQNHKLLFMRQIF